MQCMNKMWLLFPRALWSTRRHRRVKDILQYITVSAKTRSVGGANCAQAEGQAWLDLCLPMSSLREGHVLIYIFFLTVDFLKLKFS